jgi:hypothetical protein
MFLALTLALAGPALADGGITVQLPRAAEIAAVASPQFLHDLVNANVIGSNCPGYELTDGQSTLLTGSADMVAEQLGLTIDAYDAEYYGPAFDLLDKPGSCKELGPAIAPLIDRLKAMGGDTVAIG